jgi:hypothetical protein
LTSGYRCHPQLERFRACPAPAAAINRYLEAVWQEASRRSYRFDSTKLSIGSPEGWWGTIPVSAGQAEYERRLLAAKLAARAPDWAYRLAALDGTPLHPLFSLVPGPVAEWERVRPGIVLI